MRIGISIGITRTIFGSETAEAVFTDSSTVTFPDGSTVTIDPAMPVAYGALGDPIVKSDKPFSITAASNAPSVDGSGWAYNGFMETPQITAGDAVQGFDERAAQDVGSATRVFPYGDNAALPIAISQGASGVWVQGVRDPALPDVAGMSRYLALTVVEETRFVPEGFLRPAYNDPSAEIVAWEGALRRPYLSNAAFDGLATKAAAEAAIPNMAIIFGRAAEPHRRIMVTEQNGYAMDWSHGYAIASMFLNSTASDADKRMVWLRMVQHGIDIDGLVRHEGYTGYAAAGQYGRTIVDYGVAVCSIASASMLARLQSWKSNCLDQPVIWRSEDVGLPARWGDTNNMLNRIVLPEHVGQVGWVLAGRAVKFSTYLNSAQDARYAGTNKLASIYDILFSATLSGWPGGYSGGQVLRDLGADDATNEAVAPIWNADMIGWDDGVNDPSGDAARLATIRPVYRALRGLIDHSVSPSAWHTMAPDFASAGDGVIDIDLTGILDRNAPQGVQAIQIFLSQDQGKSGRVYAVNLAGSPTFSIPAPATEHYVQMRVQSASGVWSVWSANHPREVGGAMRNVVTPTDTGLNRAPTIVAEPVLRYAPYYHPTPYYLDLPATAPDDIRSYIAGIGFVDMKPWSAPSVQWYDGDPAGAGTPISGQTALELLADDGAYAGKSIYAELVFDNGVGSVSRTLGPVTPGAANFGVYYPRDENADTVPDELTEQWVAGDEVLTINTVKSLPLYYGISGSHAIIPRMYAFDRLDILGAGAALDIPEFDLLFQMERNSNSTSAIGVVFRASGASAGVADGYGLDFYVTSIDGRFAFSEITGGVASATYPLGEITDQEITYSLIQPMWCRMNVKADGLGGINVLARMWREEDIVDAEGEVITPGYDEPSTWAFQRNIPVAKSGTQIGFGVTRGDAPRWCGPISISPDPDVPAPKVY